MVEAVKPSAPACAVVRGWRTDRSQALRMAHRRGLVAGVRGLGYSSHMRACFPGDFDRLRAEGFAASRSLVNGDGEQRVRHGSLPV